MINNYEFGEFVIDGRVYECNVKLIQDKVITVRHFDNHIIKLDDFMYLVFQKPSYTIIGTRAYGVIKVTQDIIDYIEKHKIKLIIKKTAEACTEYNRLLKQGKKVCALLHNTC